MLKTFIAIIAITLAACTAPELCGPPGFEKFHCSDWANMERARAAGMVLPYQTPVEVRVVGERRYLD